MPEVYKTKPSTGGDLPTPTPEAAPAVSESTVPSSEELLAHPDAPAPVKHFGELEVPDHDLVFKPRTLGSRVFGLLAVGLGIAAAAMTVAAFQNSSTQNTGIAVTLWVLAAIIWAVRAGNSTARLSLNGPMLLVEHKGRREVFDLSSKWTPIHVDGNPNSMNWKVTFRRPEIGPYVIDSSMVDPTEFMKVMTFFRSRIKPDD